MGEIEPGTTIAGKYRVEQRLSRGGMGSVWLACHVQLDAPVAIKFMRPSLLSSAGARARFEREAKAAAQIRSPYVVHIYDHGIDADTPFIVMEYLEGVDLQARLRGRKRLPPRSAVRVCEEVCKGLERAHKLGIVHRDLKPGNIWLSEPDDDMVKILDFGIAKETGDSRVVRGETTTTGQLLGSPHYMSPEQARGQKLDGRSDLWSLAVILFRALTGTRPFDGNDIGDLIVRICMDPIPVASSLNPALPKTADEFFERAFVRQPDGRFQTAREFAAAFREALAGAAWQDEPVVWDGRSSNASLTQTPSSEKFGNIIGPMPVPAEVSHIGDDTFAATAAPLRGRRRVALGAVAALALTAVVVVVIMKSGGRTDAAARAPEDEAASTSTLPAISTPPGAPTGNSATELAAGNGAPSRVPSASANPSSRAQAPVPSAQTRTHPRASDPSPAPRPTNVFGY